jgi:hypothetical protein
MEIAKPLFFLFLGKLERKMEREGRGWVSGGETVGASMREANASDGGVPA